MSNGSTTIRRRSIGMIAAAAAAISIASTGCDYERIDILVGRDNYNGRIMTHYKDVEVIRGGVRLKPGSRFSIKTPLVTQFIGQFDVAIVEGTGVNIYLRTVPHNFSSENGLAFRYATDGSSLRTAEGTTLALPHNAEVEPHTIRVTNEAALVSIAVDCDLIYEGQTNLPATEYVIFEPLPGSTIELRKVNYYESNLE